MVPLVSPLYGLKEQVFNLTIMFIADTIADPEELLLISGPYTLHGGPIGLGGSGLAGSSYRVEGASYRVEGASYTVEGASYRLGLGVT